MEADTNNGEHVEAEEPELESESDPIISEGAEFTSVKKEIEAKCNFATAEEAMDAVTKDPSVIVERLKTGFDMFEEQTGKRGMTYSQLREMFG